MSDIGPGTLLVASPELVDPNFADSVVLLLDSDDDGVLGVVLNRPLQVAVSDVVEPWAEICAAPEVIFQGGPVSPEGAIALALLRDSDDAPVGFQPVSGRIGVIDLDTPVELVDGSLAGMRIFAGYAGWGADQLVAEIEEGAWYVLASDEADAFGADPARLWGEVMRRQPGHLAWHATRPVDPGMN